MSKFKLILTALFSIFIVAGVATFATYKGKSSTIELPEITVWGTFSSSLFNEYLNKINSESPNAIKVVYTQIPESNFNKTFIESLARGQGPDAILISQDSIHKFEDKIIQIPYKSISKRTFQNTFIRQSELYLATDGILALPFIVDPMVMYWNRDIFINAGIANYPKYWDEFLTINPKITKKDANSNIRRSTIAMGEFNNIYNAREILGTLFLQAGNPITYSRFYSETPISVVYSALGDSNDFNGLNSSVSALNFFTQFSNPSNPNYSWNRSLINSRNSFLSGSLATYFGFASEIKDIRQKNPNIDFDIAPMPQIRTGVVENKYNRVTYGKMYGLSIVRSTKDVNSTLSVLSILINSSYLKNMIDIAYLPPVLIDIIADGSSDPYLSIFYDSALISKGWLDTDKEESNTLFQDIVESVSSGRKTARDSLQNGSDKFDILLKKL